MNKGGKDTVALRGGSEIERTGPWLLHSPPNRDLQSRATGRKRPTTGTRGWGGGEGRYYGIHPDPGGPLNQGGLWGIVLRQPWYSPLWSHIGLWGLAGVLAWPHGHSIPELGRAKWKGWEILCGWPGERALWSMWQTVELGAVHCLSEDDPATILACHHILQNLVVD